MENFKLNLPQEWVARILQIMSKQPYDQVADMIDGIKSQVSRQIMEQRAPQQGVAQPGNGTAVPVPDTPATVQ